MHGMEDMFGEVLVPTEEVVEMRAGQKRKSERKFFPGYVLVQMIMDETTWHLVRNVPRVMGFIGGTSDRPAPISDKEADAILNRLQDAHDKPRPKTLFEPGEMVRVADGPFADFNGTVEEVDYEKPREGLRFDLRSFYAGRAGFWSGRKGLIKLCSLTVVRGCECHYNSLPLY